MLFLGVRLLKKLEFLLRFFFFLNDLFVSGRGSEMALINLEAHVLLLSGGFVVLMLQSKLLFIQPDWNLTMTSKSL